MILWTTQQKEFYDELMRNGVAFCRQLSDLGNDMVLAYRWMADQMRKRIGEPPLPEIQYPVWAWYQYGSGKWRKPPLSVEIMSCGDSPSGVEVMMELDVPDNQALLSDFDLWHIPLNYSAYWIHRKKNIVKKAEKQFGYRNLEKFPPEVQKMFFKSWEKIFDLRPKHKSSYTKYIQATLWWVKKEWVVSTETIEFRTELASDAKGEMTEIE